MTNFIADNKGNSYLWAAFIIIIFSMFTAVIYNVIYIYTTINTARNDLERAAVVTVNENLINENVRDLNYSIPTDLAIVSFYDNLDSLGYQNTNNVYIKKENDKAHHSISNITISIDDDLMEIDATLTIPLLWQIESISEVEMLLHTISRVYSYD